MRKKPQQITDINDITINKISIKNSFTNIETIQKYNNTNVLRLAKWISKISEVQVRFQAEKPQ